MPTDDLPASVDWKSKGAVTSARRQGTCGSCYAFVASAALESYNKIKNGGKLLRLSPQQLIDCSSSDEYGNLGCDGGFIDYVFSYAVTNSVMLELDYPYEEKYENKCRYVAS